jgi:hypothetical protein
MKNYEYLIFDGSYYLMKCLASLQKTRYSEYYITNPMTGEQIQSYQYDFREQDIVRLVYWSLMKFIIEEFSCEKAIVVFDVAPYYKVSYLPDYKGDRTHYTDESLKEVDPNDPRAYWETKEEIRCEKMKVAAKNWMIENFSNIGLTTIAKQGWEGDELAYLTSKHLIDRERKSALVSIDTDWDYLVNPNVDHLKTHMRKETEIVTYDQVITWIPEGMDPYIYKAYEDSLGGSHNNLASTYNSAKFGKYTWRDTIEALIKGDESVIQNKELFDLQFKSFDIWSLSDFDEMREYTKARLDEGCILNENEFELFCQLTGFKVRTYQYSDRVCNLNPEYYKSEVKLF